MIKSKLCAILIKLNKLWHSHVVEVKSGMLLLQPVTVPQAVSERTETAEREGVIWLYGEMYYLWQVTDHKVTA
jgi:hypothetical protein